MRIQRRGGLVITAAALVLLGAACGGSGDSNEKASDNAKSSASKASSEQSEKKAEEKADEKAEQKPAEDPAMAGLVGPGCADYAKQVPSGAGSVSGMAEDPVATAASNNPLLKTLVTAVSGKLNPKVNLVDTLNGGEFTVFAPVDSAFAKIPAKTIEGLKSDDKTLTAILTYHVVPGKLAPDAVAGEHKTAQGTTVEVSGSGNDLKVDDAKVICGGVKTSNATVYLIDSVLMPK